MESENEAQRMLEEQREAKADYDKEFEREQDIDARRSPNAVPLLEVQGIFCFFYTKRNTRDNLLTFFYKYF